MNSCSKCGAPLENGKCNYCGATHVTPTTETTASVQGRDQAAPQVIINQVAAQGTSIDIPPKSKWVAFFLCLFLGFFGAHNFYAGKIGMGVLYLFTLGFLGIGWLIDIIRILIGAYYDKWGRKLQG